MTEDKFTKYDELCKRVLAHKLILSRILKTCVEEFYDCTLDDIMNKYIEGEPEIGEAPLRPDQILIHGDSGEDTSLSEQTIRYDIKFRASAPGDGGEIGLIINIEAQRKFDPGYPLIKRGLYYCSRMISSQYGTEFTRSHYEKLKKVYSIWLCMDPPEEWQDSITAYRLTEENIHGSVRARRSNYDLIKLIMVCPGENSEPGSLQRLISLMFSRVIPAVEKDSILLDEFNLSMPKDLKEEVDYMCNLSYGIAEDATITATFKTRLEAIRNMMSALGLDFNRAADIMRIPAAERDKYRKLIESDI